jgi:uncharacterized membrane protein
MSRWLLTSLTWLVATVVLLPICFFTAIVLAGPHSGMLPRLLEPPVFVACWLVLLVVPVLAARGVWRRRG